jgi:Flp pilus assembly protein TadG
MKEIRSKAISFQKSERGSIAAIFALMIPLIMAAAGVAVDLSNTYLVQKRLGQALDAAALAAASSTGEESVIYDRLERFLIRNYEAEGYPEPSQITMRLHDNLLFAAAEARVNTSFMKLFGKPYVDVYVETEIKREVRGLEVILVLDNTGSMASNNNIAALRTASENFVNILFDATSQEEGIKIGLVPYSTSVNVGSYGFGQNPDGSYYDDPFVNNPHGLNYSTWSSNDWQGCVLAGDYPLDVEDHEGPWDMYRYCRDASENIICDSYWRWGQLYPRRDPNYICPGTTIHPLSSNRASLISHISTMRADGWTLGNYGLAWGWRLISPEFPFQEGADWQNREWKKAVIMMTDGVNTMHQHYTAYGRTSDHNIRPNDLNERMEEVCDAMKQLDIILYTVTFEGGVNETTKDFFRRCATSPEQYFDAPTQQELITVFEKISRELSNLHISR